jgi:hypothetical protein
MRIVIFCHSLISDWNHGNAHFLRGVVAELLDRSHEVAVYEPADGWSRQNGCGLLPSITAVWRTAASTRRSTAQTSSSCTSGARRR